MQSGCATVCCREYGDDLAFARIGARALNMTENLLYTERLSSKRTEMLFVALTLLFFTSANLARGCAWSGYSRFGFLMPLRFFLFSRLKLSNAHHSSYNQVFKAYIRHLHMDRAIGKH